MNILYNSEYIDFDITTIPGWENRLKMQKTYYPQWEGKIYGDFEIMKVEYDWFLSKQRALLKCVHCGYEKYTNNPREFRRGKAGSQKCDCQKSKINEKSKKEIIRYNDFVGEEKNGFVSFKYSPGKGMFVCCVKCMKEKWVSGKDFITGNVTCNHKIKAQYGEELIGKKFGDLTVLKKQGYKYLCRCECGFEKIVEGCHLVNDITCTCGRPECEYHMKRVKDNNGNMQRLKGLQFEHELQDVFEKAGYEVTRTPDSGDYGVDFIAVINGEKWAFQCKNTKKPSSTHAILEVYAGGRFYDCTRFCVISPSGFSVNAMKCAAKLGVQLEKNRFRLNVKLANNTKELLETANHITIGGKREQEWTIDGVTKPASQWCKEYGVTRKQVYYRMSAGMTRIEALKYVKPNGRITIEINGKIKTKQEWCEEFGISTQLYDYRTKQGKMTPYKALTTPILRNAKNNDMKG